MHSRRQLCWILRRLHFSSSSIWYEVSFSSLQLGSVITWNPRFWAWKSDHNVGHESPSTTHSTTTALKWSFYFPEGYVEHVSPPLTVNAGHYTCTSLSHSTLVAQTAPEKAKFQSLLTIRPARSGLAICHQTMEILCNLSKSRVIVALAASRRHWSSFEYAGRTKKPKSAHFLP